MSKWIRGVVLAVMAPLVVLVGSSSASSELSSHLLMGGADQHQTKVVGATAYLDGRLVTGDYESGWVGIEGATIKGVHHHPDGSVTEVEPVTTGYGGGFALAVTLTEPGTHTVDVLYDGDATHSPTQLEYSWLDARYATKLTIQGPERLPLDPGPVSFTVQVTREDGTPVVGAQLSYARAEKYCSADKTGSTTTDSSGNATVVFGPLSSQRPFLLCVDAAATDVEWSTWGTRLWRGTPNVFIQPGKSVYRAWETATITTGATDGQPVIITLQPEGGVSRVIDSVEESGWYIAHPVLTRNTTVTVASPQSYYWEAATATRKILVAPSLREAVSGYYASRDGTFFVHSLRSPALSTKVSPARAGRCVKLQVQKHATDGWRQVKQSACLSLSSDSRMTHAIGKFTAGTLIRTRYISPADAMNAFGNGAWVRVRVTQ